MPGQNKGLIICIGSVGRLGTSVDTANMAVTIYAFLEAILLLVNAVAVLNDERFLAKSRCSYSILRYLTIGRKHC